MATGTSGNLYSTQLIKITNDQYAETTDSGTKTVQILNNVNAAKTYFIKSVQVYCSEAWASDTVTCSIGIASDTDRYVTSVADTLGASGISNGVGFAGAAITTTTAGANTGTSGAGLSLIPATVTGAVADDDNAATTGAAVNVVPENNGITAYLESTTAGNADTTFEVGNGGPTVVINDNDTPGGVQLYFDEDAASTDSRFLAVSPTGADLFVPTVNGAMIRVAHDASAATNGVAVYADDDAANAYEKLLFVSPTDTAGSYTLDDTVGMQTSNTTVMNDLLALQEDIDAINTRIASSSLLGGCVETYAANTGMRATLTTDGSAWQDLTAGEYIIIVEYLDIGDLTNLL